MRTRGRLAVTLASVVAVLVGLAVPAGTSAAASPSVVVSRVNTSSKVIALTFDVGSDVGNVQRILTALAGQGVKSTFFVGGEVAAANPTAIRSVVTSGHEIGNHSYRHRSFTGLTAAQIADELSRGAAAIRSATGQSPRPFFRPPNGAYDAAVLQAVGNAGYPHTIMWTIDTADWQGLSSTVIRDKVVRGAVPGAIVLMHAGAGAPGTPGALPGMITSLKASGYRFVTISQLLASTPSGQRVHVVQPGETLYRIAQRYGVTVAAIVAANNITNPNLIHPGQVLIIPGGTAPPPPPPSTVLYTVRSGDTLYSIARRFGVTVAAIVAANNITNPNVIHVGQVLRIPTGSAPPPPPSTVLYTVRSGDTLYSIARRFGVTVAAIVAANNITNPDLIRVGQVLRIPT